MPNIRMPNGDVVAFPDDMPKEQIKNLIASKFPELANGERQDNQPVANVQLGADRAQANDAQVAEQTAEGRREAYNQKPWYQQAAQAADDEARLLASGATFGFADKLSSGLNSMISDRTYEDQLKAERNATQAARDRASSAALPSEIAGSVLTGSLAANNGATLAGRLGTANMSGLKGVLARAGLMVPEGAMYGTLDALGNDKDVKTGAITGAIAAPIGSVVGDTVSKIASKVLPAKTPNTVPSLEKLRAAADDAYAAADSAGVVVNPQSVQRLRQNVEQKLAAFGYHPANQPGVKAALDDLERISQGNVTLKGLDVLRRVTKNAYSPTNPSQSAASKIVVDEIDDFVRNIAPGDVVMGDAKAGVKSLKEARELWSRVRKNETFMDAVEAAKLRANSTGSGGNEENAVRQNLRRFIDPASSKRMALSADEQKAMKEIVTGTPTQNALRLVGKLSPSGNGLTMMLHLLGAGVTGGASVPFAGAGIGAKYMADRGVRNGVAALDELIRAGGSQQALQSAQATLRSLSQSQRDAIGRIVEMSIIQSRQEQPAQ